MHDPVHQPVHSHVSWSVQGQILKNVFGLAQETRRHYLFSNMMLDNDRNGFQSPGTSDVDRLAILYEIGLAVFVQHGVGVYLKFNIGEECTVPICNPTYL